ncbi:hypothetical protein E1B28_008750 [Marasmius oreades]|uniref:Protein N-terminal glutamine amidohydrolase n=1 Tax=Marasmius oreades TaxID=181124 RepID=A0A9P7RZK3_9AGAR|nr:uncharacterized protein E1B28_008750 [Marasmius oreades]KAG7092393.1 hypothetical protein E1B28_008750 [Marasmius oreades]
MEPPLPPALPMEVQYTRFWCEENIYILARQFIQEIDSRWKVFVVFISNTTKTVALLNQRSAMESQRPVIWDYHVILVLRYECARSKPCLVTSWVYDFDSGLDIPSTWKDYYLHTFSPVLLVELQSTFRIVSGDQFVDNFASDRSHMTKGARRRAGVPLTSAVIPLYLRAKVCR